MNSAPLAQSADKQVLFARLGLNEQIHKILLVRSGRASWEPSANLMHACSTRPRERETL
jgi:hypothetical protein